MSERIVMANYRQVYIKDNEGWYLMNPKSAWEAIRIAWMMWRHPDRVGALVGIDKSWAEKNLNL